ncbi:hypothetical protein LCGC14_0611390 [marine sediment metagenome]|uniref:Uncharacterized protein n=1 Tax=marine sediment metagenome TaxID=412755 RepID=A0A0F9RRX0_9ZZZZ
MIDLERETQETTQVTKGKNGRTFQTYETKYVDTGELVGKREETTTYYATGELKKIKQKRFDANGNLLKERNIKYFKDGRQPEIEME